MRQATGRRRVLGGLWAALNVGFAGCLDAFMSPPLERVTVSIVDVRKPSLGATSASIPVIIELDNSSSQEIPSPSITVNIFVEGQEVGDGSEALPTVRPRDSVTESLEIIVEYEEMAEGVVNAIRTNQFTLELRGRISSDGAEKEFTTVYEY